MEKNTHIAGYALWLEQTLGERGYSGRMLKPSEVARVCEVHTKTVYRAIRRGDLVASRLGVNLGYRISPGAIVDWVTGSKVEPSMKPEPREFSYREPPVERIFSVNQQGRLEVGGQEAGPR